MSIEPLTVEHALPPRDIDIAILSANGTRWSYSYNGGLIESHTCSIEPRHFQLS